ncbi:MAG TPA: putative metallopeptidase [Geobacteraceae bacterium]
MSTLNLTAELERLIADIAASHTAFGHIDPRRLLVCVATARNDGRQGTFAKIHPLRFAGGERSTLVRRGRRCLELTMPSVVHRDTEMLYVIYFMAPRFFDLSLRDKLITVFHELYHISPSFDGDIRRFPGRNYAHGSSRQRYNALMARLLDEYLAKPGVRELVTFLDGTMAELRQRHHAIVGRRLPMPKLSIAGS